MNSSSIVLAFFLAGVVSVAVHNVALGLGVFSANNAEHQTATNSQDSFMQIHISNTEQLSVKKVKIPL